MDQFWRCYESYMSINGGEFKGIHVSIGAIYMLRDLEESLDRPLNLAYSLHQETYKSNLQLFKSLVVVTYWFPQ